MPPSVACSAVLAVEWGRWEQPCSATKQWRMLEALFSLLDLYFLDEESGNLTGPFRQVRIEMGGKEKVGFPAQA